MAPWRASYLRTPHSLGAPRPARCSGRVDFLVSAEFVGDDVDVQLDLDRAHQVRVRIGRRLRRLPGAPDGRSRHTTARLPPRLRQLRTTYDPNGLFRGKYVIPAAA